MNSIANNSNTPAKMIKKISIIGAGSWGTALALLLANKCDELYLWGYKKEFVDTLEYDRQNKKYLPGKLFSSNIRITNELSEATFKSEIIILAVPSHGYREIFNRIIPYLSENSIIISAVKGIENESLMTMTSIMEESLVKEKHLNNIEYGVLSGPSFAEEVANKVPTAVTIGFKNLKTAKKVQQIFVNDYFRVYASSDVIGLEISAC